MALKAWRALVLAVLCGCGCDEREDRLRPATAEECPGGGTVLERTGQDDVVCEGDVVEPEPVAACEDAQKQIAAQLARDVQRAYVSQGTEACGPSGIESGVVEFGEALVSPMGRQALVDQYQGACAAMAAACQQ